METKTSDQIVGLAIIVVLGVSSLALLGWIFDVPFLRSIKAEWIAMKPVSVFCLWLCAGALFFANSRSSNRIHRILCLWPGVLVFVVGLLSCLAYFSVLYSGQEMGWVYKPLLSRLFDPPSRMAPLTAILFMAFGLAFTCLSFSKPPADAVSHALMLPVTIMSYVVIVGYLFQGATLITWMNVPVAFNTGIAFLALSTGIFYARPDTWFMSVFSSRGVGGRIANRLLPVLLLVYLLIGWLRFAAVESGLMSLEKANTLSVTANSIVLFAAIWFTARSANFTDERRKSAEEALRKAHDELEQRVRERTAELEKTNAVLRLSEEHFRLTFDQSPIGAAVIDLNYRFERVNRTLCRITGYEEDELRRISIVDIAHPSDVDANLEQVQKLTAGEIDRYDMEKRYIRKDGNISGYASRWGWFGTLPEDPYTLLP